jgi:hypothetical protein
MSSHKKNVNRDLLEKISKELNEIKRDIFFIKNTIKVLNDKTIIQSETKTKTNERPISEGWFW